MILAMALVAGLAASAPPPPDARSLEREARQIEGMLIAPCCWTQPVAVHYSAEADEVRVGIRRLLGEGKTRQQVLDAFVAQYGTRILADPPVAGLHWLPWLFLVTGGTIVVVAVRHLRTNRAESAGEEPSAPSPADDDYAGRLEEELQDLD
jgi:cytochrome c-type biogenesis protein CcmH